jgi:hypothetical protein
VRFGNVAATVVSSGYASIVAVAPPGLPLSARISVTTADGTATSTDRFMRTP